MQLIEKFDAVIRIEKVTKIEAGQRQLRTACRLFFQGGDSVSVHTLAWAAHEIFTPDPKSDGSFLLELADRVPDGQPHVELTEARNFFKHYHNKPLKTLKFIENLNEWLLLDCAQMYRSITGRQIREAYGVSAWISLRLNQLVLDHPLLMEYIRVWNPSKKQLLDWIDTDVKFQAAGFE